MEKSPSICCTASWVKCKSTIRECCWDQGIGEDAALIDYGDKVLVAKTDPITFATDLIGWYAVQVNANDIACAGATPRWFLASLLLPTSITEDGIAAIFAQLTDACAALDVSLVGGHTEITQGLSQPIVVGCMLGEGGKR